MRSTNYSCAVLKKSANKSKFSGNSFKNSFNTNWLQQGYSESFIFVNLQKM